MLDAVVIGRDAVLRRRDAALRGNVAVNHQPARRVKPCHASWIGGAFTAAGRELETVR